MQAWEELVVARGFSEMDETGQEAISPAGWRALVPNGAF